MSGPFLTASWANIVLLTFEAPEDLVKRHIHPLLEPDRWDGKTHVSLVALDMLDVRVRGWRIPGFRAHPQVNFRTYVRHGTDRGVWFIRQLVPNPLVALVAQLRFREPFGAVPIESRTEETAQEIRVAYRLGPAHLPWRIAVTGSRATHVPSAGSPEFHFKERYLGYRRGRHGRLRTFRVEHLPWAVRDVRAVDYEVDFGALYGEEWGFLNERKPVSVVFAVGSAVGVYPPAVNRRDAPRLTGSVTLIKKMLSAMAPSSLSSECPNWNAPMFSLSERLCVHTK